MIRWLCHLFRCEWLYTTAALNERVCGYPGHARYQRFSNIGWIER